MRAAIADGTFAGGDSLVEEELAARYRGSRTPVREALRRLAHEGLVTIADRRGATVVDYSLRDIVEIYTIREALEGMAARLAADLMEDAAVESLEEMFEGLAAAQRQGRLPEAGDRIHDVILQASGNRRLGLLMDVNKVHQARLHRTATRLPGRVEQSFLEHQRILAALKSRDPDAAEHVIREHIRSTRRSLIESASR